MKIRKTWEEEERYNSWEYKPDQTKFLAVYARQSDPDQVKKHTNSRDMQLEDLRDIAITQLGWPPENIRLYDADMGISSQKKDRVGILDLMSDVDAGLISMIFVQSIDRLFRDEFNKQSGPFAEICKAGKVLVRTFFGSDYRMWEDRDKESFLVDCLRSYSSYKLQIRDKMAYLLRRKSQHGENDGRRLAVGYMWNPAKPTELIPYPPHAERVVHIYQRCQALNYEVWQLFRELVETPAMFPDFPAELAPLLAPYIKTGMRKVPGGYTISYKNLFYLLTNEVYVGSWMYHGKTVIENHHAPIIPPALFEDVSINVQRKLEMPRRFQQKDTPRCPAILYGLTVGGRQDETVSSCYRGQDTWAYRVTRKVHGHPQPYASYPTAELDACFSVALFGILEDTDKFKDYSERMKQVLLNEEREKKKIAAELRGINAALEGGLLSLQDPTLDAEDRQALIGARAAQKLRREELQKLSTTYRQSTGNEALTYIDLIKKLQKYWDDPTIVSPEEKKYLVAKICDRVVFTPLSCHFLEIKIYWRIAETQTLILWKPKAIKPVWSEEDKKKLRLLYLTAPVEEIMQTFPDRTWVSIQSLAMKERLSGRPRTSQPPYPTLSLEDREVIEQRVSKNYSIIRYGQMVANVQSFVELNLYWQPDQGLKIFLENIHFTNT